MANSIPTPDKSDTISAFARAGYAARGVVYLLVGGLAILAAFGKGGQAEGSRGALEWLMSAPWGKVILVAIALGLVGYSLWRFIQSIKDTDNHGTDAKGLAVRGGLFVSAITHLLLAFFAANLIFTLGSSSGGSDNGSENAASWLMQQPFGRWLLGIVGLIIIGVGVAHVIKGVKAKFDRYFDMKPDTQRWAYPICRFGLVIRGLVFFIIGGFFIVAAYQIDPQEAGGLSDVFNTLREQPYGPWLLAFVAIGLFAFGLYSILESIYRRVNPS